MSMHPSNAHYHGGTRRSASRVYMPRVAHARSAFPASRTTRSGRRGTTRTGGRRDSLKCRALPTSPSSVAAPPRILLAQQTLLDSCSNRGEDARDVAAVFAGSAGRGRRRRAGGPTLRGAWRPLFWPPPLRAARTRPNKGRPGYAWSEGFTEKDRKRENPSTQNTVVEPGWSAWPASVRRADSQSNSLRTIARTSCVPSWRSSDSAPSGTIPITRVVRPSMTFATCSSPRALRAGVRPRSCYGSGRVRMPSARRVRSAITRAASASAISA
jgi:hypothetical protein